MKYKQPQSQSRMGAPPQHASIDLRIEELVLHGFAPGDRYRIAEAVERELSSVVADQGMPALGGDWQIDHLNGGSFGSTHRLTPEAIGKHVAHEVYGNLSRPHLASRGRTGSQKES